MKNPCQAPHDVIKRSKCVINHVVDVSFNMGKSNSPHTLRSGSTNIDRCITTPRLAVGKKILLLIGHRMESEGAQFAKISAKMLATEQA